MKKYRPYCAGYIVLYVLFLLCLGDAAFTAIRKARGVNDLMTSFSLFSYLMLAMAACYTWFYARAKVVIDGTKLRFAFPANVRCREGQQRAFILFRQGDMDMKLIDKTIDLKKLVQYGYVEDLGYEPIDQSPGGDKNKLFPVHEVALITNENKRYHMNAAIYSAKQQREIFTQIRDISGIEPQGSLADVLSAGQVDK